MRKKSGNQTLTLALSGMMAALVFVATYFFKPFRVKSDFQAV